MLLSLVVTLVECLHIHPATYDRAVAQRPAPQMALSTNALWVVGSVAGGAAGTPVVLAATRTWYRRIELPSWTPPDQIFAPVWTSLYAMMGLASAQVAGVRGVGCAAVMHFGVHYAVNLAWAPVFFGLRKLRLALAMQVALVASLAVLIAQYAGVAASAGLLLLPYMAWLLFATWLNVVICRLNPTVGGYNNAQFQADLLALQRRASQIACVLD